MNQVDHYKYKRQKAALEDIAKELGVTVFYPGYHAQGNNKNTVLLYLPEDAAHNDALDRDGKYLLSEDFYHPYFFAFENSDVNGNMSLDFANHGSIDLRGLNWKDVLKGKILEAKNKFMEKECA